MKHTQEEILKALQVLKDVCKESNNCKECPLGDHNNECCFENGNPAEIELNYNTQVWRAHL